MADIVERQAAMRASHTIGNKGVERSVPVSYGDVRDKLLRLPHVHDGYLITDIFTVRHRLISGLDPPPESVFEFGCLRGYFLVTALDAAPTITTVGWVDNESHAAGSNQQALHNIYGYWKRERLGPEPSVWWARNAWESADFGGCDLVQVDGDHSYEGCFSDLIWARRMQPRAIFVDDYRAHLAVQEATKRFAVSHSFQITEHETVNGLAVLTPSV